MAHAFSPSSGPLTVPSFSIETPESNFQGSYVRPASGGQKTQPGHRHSDWEGLRQPVKAAGTDPDQFVRTKLSQLEVPEAVRTTRFSASPVFGGEVNLAVRFGMSTGNFIPIHFSVSRPARFPERACRLARPGEGSTGNCRFFDFSRGRVGRAGWEGLNRRAQGQLRGGGIQAMPRAGGMANLLAGTWVLDFLGSKSRREMP